MQTPVMTYTVTLTITLRESEGAPDVWDWPLLLDLNPIEDATLVKCEEVGPSYVEVDDE